MLHLLRRGIIINTAGPTLSFDSAKLLLNRYFGYQDFNPGQAQPIRSVISGRDLLVVMPTGSGKSLLYQLPALFYDRLTLVISPLISLMKDQVDDLNGRGIPATAINSSLRHDEQRRRLDACAAGEYRLLYIAPERCQEAALVKTVAAITVARLAVDEAHCISEWGHDFRPDYRRLQEFRRRLGGPPVTALTATATPTVQSDIMDSLGLYPENTDVFVRGFDRPNLQLSVAFCHNDRVKVECIREYLSGTPGCGIIYTGTRKTAEKLVLLLSDVEPSITAYHAGMGAQEREAAQELFLGGGARVVAATSAFGMGIDKRDVRFVLHYSYPGSIEQYYQEVGRAGRDGKRSQCMLLYSPADRGLHEYFINGSFPSKRSVRSVFEALWNLPERTVTLTHKELVSLCAGFVREGQVDPALRLLDAAGIICYERRDQERGISKLSTSSPDFDSLDIDWHALATRRRMEEARLLAMEGLIHSHRCRREYILRYFGELEEFRCGSCDRCLMHDQGRRPV